MTLAVLGIKDPDADLEVAFDFEEELVQPAHRQDWVAVDTVVRYPIDTGWYYVVTTAGKLAQHYPNRLPRAEGQVLNDGTAVLQCIHPGDATIPLILSVDWTVPAGLTLASQSDIRTKAKAVLRDGEEGVDYEVLCRMTPTSGNPVERTGIVQVRSL